MQYRKHMRYYPNKYETVLKVENEIQSVVIQICAAC